MFGIPDIGNVIGAVGSAADALFTSDEERLKAGNERLEIEQRPQMGQLAINKQEAKHKSLFVAGARPFTIWACTIMMILTVIAAVTGFFMDKDMTPLLAIYGALVAPPHLALLGLRTYEKGKGIHVS